MISYHNKKFCTLQNSNNGETSSETIFHYTQKGQVVQAFYEGGKIVAGHLIGIVDETGVIQMVYHQVNTDMELMTGKCISTPEILENGKIRLHEKWQWTSGDFSAGNSVIEEME